MRSPDPLPASAASRPATEARAKPGPIPTPVSAAGEAAPAPSADTAAAARGRRTLSTAFVMVGPDGYLTVERADGRVLALRDVAMRREDYCGTPAAGDRYCGGYAEVAAARPGGGPAPAEAVSTDPGVTARAVPRRP